MQVTDKRVSVCVCVFLSGLSNACVMAAQVKSSSVTKILDGVIRGEER